MNLKIKKTNPQATIPTYGTNGAAGFDLHACITRGSQFVPIREGETRVIDTGIAVAIPHGYVGLVFPRSGWATKKGLTLANCVGVIDEDYRGTIGVALHNQSNAQQVVRHNDRVAQMAIIPFIKCEFDIVDELDKTERGDGGFGSTGE